METQGKPLKFSGSNKDVILSQPHHRMLCHSDHSQAKASSPSLSDPQCIRFMSELDCSLRREGKKDRRLVFVQCSLLLLSVFT